jgi:hypothetical protein
MVADDMFWTGILKGTILRIEPGTFHRHGEWSSTELYGVLQLLESATCLLTASHIPLQGGMQYIKALYFTKGPH